MKTGSRGSAKSRRRRRVDPLTTVAVKVRLNFQVGKRTMTLAQFRRELDKTGRAVRRAAHGG